MAEGAGVESFFAPDGVLAGALPRFEYRPSQVDMAKAVWECLRDSTCLMVEAGTGTGKTFAYLVPALLSGRKTVVSTATKALQDQILDHDVPVLIRRFFPKARVRVLKGRRNYLCLRRFKEFAYQPSFWNREEAALFSAVHEWAARTKTGDRSEADWLPDQYQAWNDITSAADQCLAQQCPHYEECFVQRSRLEAARADLLILNHHLFFATLTVEERGSGDLLSSFPAVIFDEAHHVEDVAGLYFGLELSSWAITELCRDVHRALVQPKIPAAFRTECASACERITQNLKDVYKHLGASGTASAARHRLDFAAAPPALGEAVGRLREGVDQLGRTLQGRPSSSAIWESLETRAGALLWKLDALVAQEDPTLTYWYEAGSHSRGFALRATPLDIAPILLDKVFAKKEAVVLASATLATVEQKRPSFRYARERLGAPENARELFVPSPFDFQTQAALYIPKPFPLPNDPRFCLAMAEKAIQIMNKTQGRALFLFTSYRHMHETHRLLAERLPFPVLCQGEKSKRKLLAEFRENIHSVLFATYSFWEGIDVPGQALSCVLIDKLPFEVPNDPITASRVERLTHAGENAFYRYQVPRAVLQLKQGFGRLIRTRQDKGILVLFDTRVLSKPYGKIFLESLPPMPVVHHLDSLPEHLLSVD